MQILKEDRNLFLKLEKINAMKCFYLVLLLCFANLSAQEKKDISNKSFQMDFGSGTHGTGDLSGYSIGTVFSNYFRKKISYSIELGASIHSGSAPIFYNDKDGRIVDHSYRYTTAGFQLAGKIGFSFFRNFKNDFGLRIGPLVRYQSSSVPDEIGTYFPAGTNFPFPVSDIRNISPQNTIAVGGLLQLYYHYNISDTIFIGSSAGLQTDSNGDTITNISLACGIRF